MGGNVSMPPQCYGALHDAAAPFPPAPPSKWRPFNNSVNFQPICFIFRYMVNSRMGNDLAMPPQCLVESFSSVDKAKEIETFFDQHPLPSAKRSFQQALETVHIQTKWIERDFESLNKFLYPLNFCGRPKFCFAGNYGF